MPSIINTALNEIAMSVNGQTITGKDCYLKSYQVTREQPMEECYGIGNRHSMSVLKEKAMNCITMEFIASDLIFETFDKDYKPKIRNKKVEDCSVQELFYAIRQKIK